MNGKEKMRVENQRRSIESRRKADRANALDAQKAQRKQDRIKDYKSFVDKNVNSDGLFRIFGFVFGILLLMAIISSMTGATSGVHTFEGLLEQLTTCPQIGTDWLNWGTIEIGDWGVFNWLAEFFESIALIVNFALYIITMLMNLVVFIIWFLGWIFGA